MERRSRTTRGASGRRSPTTYHLFRGTPTGAWLDHELHELFGVQVRLDGDSAQHVYDQIAERLASPEFRPRALFERFNIEVLATTDAASDSLEHHRAIRESGWRGRVIPTFRPDAVFRIAAPAWASELDALGAGRRRRDRGLSRHSSTRSTSAARFFKSLGATATDHAVVEPFTSRLSDAGCVGDLRARASTARRRRRISGASRRTCSWRWRACPSRTDWSCSSTPGALRNHNRSVFDRFGPDKGADIPVATEYTRNLSRAAQRVRQRSDASRSCCSRSTNRRTRASSRRSPGTIRRCDSARRGGSTIRSKG